VTKPGLSGGVIHRAAFGGERCSFANERQRAAGTGTRAPLRMSRTAIPTAAYPEGGQGKWVRGRALWAALPAGADRHTAADWDFCEPDSHLRART
jgi:hypothetical protein